MFTALSVGEASWGSAETLVATNGTFQPPGGGGTSPGGFGSSLAKLQPHLWKILLENLGRLVINLQLVGGERREC